MKSEDSLYSPFTLAIPNCSLLRAWDQHMKKKPHHTSLVPWGAENVSSSAAPKAEEPSVCTGVVVLCIPVVKWGWIYKLEFAVLSAALWFSTGRSKSLIPGCSPGVLAQLCSALEMSQILAPALSCWVFTLPGGEWEPDRDKQRFPLGKIFSLGASLSWALAAAPGSWLGPERSEEWEILLNQELNWLLSMRKVETPQHPADGPAEKAKLKI